MGFFENIFGGAKKIIDGGKDVLRDQLGSEITYTRNEGITSDTGNKPKILSTGKEFLFPGRGFTDEEIKTAKPTRRDTAMGVVKTGGEIAQGAFTLTHMLGNKLADTVLPGYDAERAAASRNSLNEKITPYVSPSNPGQAKIMRGGDILGFLPVGSIKHAGKANKLDDLADVARNSLKNSDDGVRKKSLDYFRKNPEEVKKGEVRLREVEGGEIYIEDGRHRLQVAQETGVMPEFVDVTENYTGQPSTRVQAIIDDVREMPARQLENYDAELMRFSGAEAGQRNAYAQFDEWGDYQGSRSKRSTFPEWLDEDLRKRELLDKYMDGRTGELSDFDHIKYKPGSRLDRIDQQMRERLGVRTRDSVAPVDSIIEKDFNANKYVKEQIANRKTARKADNPLKKRITNQLNNINDKLIDFTGPIQRGYKRGLDTDGAFRASQIDKANVNDYIDRVFNAPAITKGFIEDNGLSDVIRGFNTNELEMFDQYLIAKHANDLAEKGVQTGRNLDADRLLVKNLGPKYDDAAQQVQQFVDARLNYMVDSGLVSREAADSLIKKHPNYVPFQRVFNEDELVEGFGTKGVASLGDQTVIRKMMGSDRQIESPLESFLQSTERMIVQGEKNKAAQMLTSYADIDGNPFGLRQIKKTTDAAKDKGTISVLRNGKKEIWEINADVADAAKALDVERLNILGKILAFPLRIARLGITGISLPFVAKNVVRDQMSAFIMSDYGLRSSVANPRVWLAGLGGAIKHGKLYNDMLSDGALMTSFDVIRDSVPQTVKKVQASKNVGSATLRTVRTPSEWLRAAEDIVSRSEEATRMQQYKGAFEAAVERGVDVNTARILASRAARENSVNFARRGEWGTVMNNTILYLNAGLQGSRLLVRNLRNKPVKTSAKIATTLMFPAATLTYWNLSDPRRKEVYEDIPEYEKENNMIIIPPNPVQDENGRWEVIKIPLQPGLGEFTSMVRRPIEASQGLDEVEFSEAASRLLRTVQPTDLQKPASSLTPQAIKPSIQAATNKNLFTGYDIVPQSMQDLPPEQQVKDNTSGTAELIGNALGASPVKTEQFIKDTFGTIANQGLRASDMALNTAGVIDDDQIGGQGLAEGVARGFTSAAGGSTEREMLDEIYTLRSKGRGEMAAMQREAESLDAELSQLPKEDANAIVKDLKENNKLLYDELVDLKKDQENQLTRVERAIKNLGVRDGTRAQYVFEQSEEIFATGGQAEANAYIKNLREKGIISDEVMKQLKKLKKESENDV